MARRRLGQHFLRDRSVARRIVDAAGISVGDAVVEIGPGDGALTHLLAEEVHRVGGSLVLVEMDEQYADLMMDRYGRSPDVRVINADARDVDLEELPGLNRGGRYRVVANLPYYAGTPIVRSFLERDRRPASLTVMLQREVARDMCASRGKMSLLSLAVQIYAEGRSLFTVPPSAFRPPPKVHSTVIELVPRDEPLVDGEDVADLFKLARSAFVGRRKQLHNSLANGLGMSTGEVKEMTGRAGIDSERRPATLGVDEWLSLLSEWRVSRELAGVSPE